MSKELMEIGGFITEGAEIVNHDNTLSGNGTVDSPLGVVPGYNETVLWEGDKTGTGTITLSEGVNNFEKLVVFISNEGKGISAPEAFETIVEFGEYSTGQYRFVLRYGGIMSKSLVADENNIYVWGGELVVYSKSYTTLNVGRTNRAGVSSITTVINHSNLTHIRKVVGINRKA